MEASSSITQQIKLSICFRAKYRVEATKVMSPMLVVPHPKNRGGDTVKSLRTMQLIATVVVDGHDSIEANCNAVAVEDKPAVAGGGWAVLPGRIREEGRGTGPRHGGARLGDGGDCG